MAAHLDRSRSLEQLEGRRWPAPPGDATPMVKNIHELRRCPVGTLEPHELARLVGQGVGLSWLLPLAVEMLKESAPAQAAGGFYDDDLLTAVVTVDPRVWEEDPELAGELKTTVEMLVDLSSYVKPNVDKFLASLPGDSASPGR